MANLQFPNPARWPEWYPAWAKELADLFFSGTTCAFVLYGNVHDLIRCPAPAGTQSTADGQSYCTLLQFLSTQVFGNWDLVLGHDLGRGLQVQAGANSDRLRKMVQALTARWGEPAGWPRDPDKLLPLLDALVERNLIEEPAARKSMAMLFEYGQYLVPAGDLGSLARGTGARLVQFLSWAQNPHIKRANIAFCLVADKLAEINDRLVESPHVAAIEIPLPSRDERLRFAQTLLPLAAGESRGEEEGNRKLKIDNCKLQIEESAAPAALPLPLGAGRGEGLNLPLPLGEGRGEGEGNCKLKIDNCKLQIEEPAAPSALPREGSGQRSGSPAQRSDFTAQQLAEMSNGLSLVNLNVLLSQAAKSERRLDARRFRELKKTMIERQCQGLVEFIEPSHTLDLLVGQEAAKKRLQDDAAWIGRGQLDLAPMGYLISGPVGTGKTFLAECYAGSIGIPCLVLRNFRSKYVGETEGNLQQVLTVLRSLGPVVVVIDEADAALGNRQSEGDSGTSARVFSMIAAQMGNTQYRGQIIWMLLTSRPDLLPIDLKRQGRAEVHIPMFYPQAADEIHQMFVALARKNKLTLNADAIPTVSPDRKLSGADIESVILAAKRYVVADARTELHGEDLARALAEFIPSAQGLEKELQEAASVLECTQQSFLPAIWRDRLAKPEGRTALQERMVAIRQLLEK